MSLFGNDNNDGNNGWGDWLANKVGFSSKSLGINTQADKQKRADEEAAARQMAELEQNKRQVSTVPQSEVIAPQPDYSTPGFADMRRMDDTNTLPSVEQPSAISQAWDATRHGATKLYQGALNKVSTPQGLETLAGIGAGAGSLYLNSLGTKAATAGQDQAMDQYQKATNANAELYRGVTDSPEQIAMRQQALQGLSQRASMGLTPEDEAALQGIQRQSQNQFKAANATIGQDMSRRGMANSGLGLAQSMGAADQAQQAQALAGQNQAAQSFATKQSALNNLAQQSGNALNADYTRQVGKANNLANVNKFNAEQQAQGAVAKGQIQQDAKAAQGQGVLKIAQGAIQSLNPNKNKPVGT
jgi:hypothetical protein